MVSKILFALIVALMLSCESGKAQQTIGEDTMNQSTQINNTTIQKHEFLSCMYSDSYFPTFLVDKCTIILKNVCVAIEVNKPQSLDELYLLTHRSTDELNNLQNEFFENNSEIETVARECLADEFEFIANTYGFEADVEELIATREW